MMMMKMMTLMVSILDPFVAFVAFVFPSESPQRFDCGLLIADF
jgi:hypothetical protein